MRMIGVLSKALLLALVLVSCAQRHGVTDAAAAGLDLRKEIDSLAMAVARDNFIGTKMMGRKPGVAPPYERRQALMAKATNEELLELTGYGNAVVNLVAFEGLYHRGHPLVPEIMKGFEEREAIITYVRGDIAMRMPMLEYAYVHVYGYEMLGDALDEAEISPGRRFALSTAERQAIELRIVELRDN